jgi:hypothetical protein
MKLTQGILSNNIFIINNSVCVCVRGSMYTAQSTIEGYNIFVDGFQCYIVEYMNKWQSL